MSMVVRLDQVWEVYSVRARAWIRATVTGLTADSATLNYESFPGSRESAARRRRRNGRETRLSCVPYGDFNDPPRCGASVGRGKGIESRPFRISAHTLTCAHLLDRAAADRRTIRGRSLAGAPPTGAKLARKTVISRFKPLSSAPWSYQRIQRNQPVTSYAGPCQGWGRGFESPRPLQIKQGVGPERGRSVKR